MILRMSESEEGDERISDEGSENEKDVAKIGDVVWGLIWQGVVFGSDCWGKIWGETLGIKFW